MKDISFTQEEREEIIRYGIMRGKIILASLILALLIGFCMGILSQSIVFLAALCPIRKFAGGYHAKTQKNCYIISLFIVIISYCCIKYIALPTVGYYMIQIISIGIIFAFSPVDNVNHKLEKEEALVYKKKTLLLTIILFGLSIVFGFFGCIDLVKAIVTANFIAAISLIAGIVSNKNEDRKAELSEKIH